MSHAAGRWIIRVRFIWIPPELGGHCRGPWVGMRWGVRWQRGDEQRDRIRYDVQCLSLTFDPSSGLWVGDFGFGIGVEVREEWLHAGERIELIGVYEVYAVGVIDARLAPGAVLAYTPGT